MPSSPRILRGLIVRGWKVYQPRLEGLSPGDTADSQQTDISFEEMELQEEDRLKKAQEEASEQCCKMLEQAADEALSIREKSRDEGYAEGFKKAEEESAGLREDARMTLEDAHRERREIIAGAEPEIIQIALNLAEKILNHKVEMDLGCILAVMARSLEALPAGQNVILRVNPLDEKICRESRQRLQGLLKKDVTLEIIPDEEIPLGSCKVQSDEAEVELHLQKELDILGKKLMSLALSAGETIIEEEDDLL
ncbi:MAG: FliH/SctL family protein [Bacillota bacterium]|nr:FliH/SctL family protein [Bacillota bacterium]